MKEARVSADVWELGAHVVIVVIGLRTVLGIQDDQGVGVRKSAFLELGLWNMLKGRRVGWKRGRGDEQDGGYVKES